MRLGIGVGVEGSYCTGARLCCVTTGNEWEVEFGQNMKQNLRLSLFVELIYGRGC